MTGSCKRSLRGVTAAFGALVVLAVGANAQFVAPNCNPSNVYKGLDYRDVSRNIGGEALVAADTAVYFFRCNNTISRVTKNLQFRMEMYQLSPCDEMALDPKLPHQGYTLVGRYNSDVRLTDPYPNTIKNTRIGWHQIRGQVIDTTGNVVGTFTGEGSIGTNTSRPPLPEGSGDCYVCHHHTGILRIQFAPIPGTKTPLGVINAFYQFDTNQTLGSATGVPCDEISPCEVGFKFGYLGGAAAGAGTLDGLYKGVCF